MCRLSTEIRLTGCGGALGLGFPHTPTRGGEELATAKNVEKPDRCDAKGERRAPSLAVSRPGVLART